LWRLARVIRRERPAVVASWSAHAAVYAQWTARARHVPCIFNVLGNILLDGKCGPVRGFRWIKSALEHSDYVISNASINLDVLRRQGVRLPANCVIFNPVVGTGAATPAEPTATPRIVAVGTLIPIKAHDVLLQALAQIASQGKSFELRVAGGGPNRASLEELAAKLGLSDRVQFLGDVEDVRGLLASAHLLVHPSRSEGMSNTILEALAEGLPVVATAVGAAPEIIQDGVNGFLVPPDQPERLAEAILRLLDDPLLRGRIGLAGFQRVRECCDTDVVIDQYEQVLRRLVPERSY